MKPSARWVLLVSWLLVPAFLGCARSSPPDVPEPNIARRVVKEKTRPKLAGDESAPAPQPPPPPPEAPKPEVKPKEAPPPKPVEQPKPEPKPEAPKAPSIVGTWRLAEMSHGGQTMPMPEGMQMTMTFSEDGSVTMTTSGGPMPEGHKEEGSYTLGDGEITITLHNDTKTAKLTFEGNDRATIEVTEGEREMRMVLSRV